MKQILLTFCVLLCATFCFSQNSPTKFMGIPIEGTKSDMIQKLKSKGFKENPLNNEILSGEFNGKDVNVYIDTNHGKVYRIMVAGATPTSEREIIVEYNALYRQFENNPRYIKFDENADYTIPADINLSYEMDINHKTFEADYIQLPFKSNSVNKEDVYKETLINYLKGKNIDINKISQSEIERYSKEAAKDTVSRFVWFRIAEYYGQYFINIYYDNINNKPDGEDL